MTSSQRTSLGRGHGAVPDGLPVFDDESPAVANLDPELLDALRRGAAAAPAAGGGARAPPRAPPRAAP
ncbi:hypothetical protein ABT262_19055, partial [Amycolatopsis mediterranei]